MIDGLTGWLVNDSPNMMGDIPFNSAAFFVFIAIVIVIFIASYVYSSLTLMQTAKRLKTKDPWMAWIPVANIYLMSRMAKASAWPMWLLLSFALIIPGLFNPIVLAIALLVIVVCFIVFAVFATIWQWKICELRGKPGWWVLIPIIISFLGAIPVIGIAFSIVSMISTFVIWGILAWGK